MDLPLVMSERGLRRSMLALSASIALGTLGELVLAEHTADPVQWVPFSLLGLGLGAILTALAAPGRRSLLVLRLAALLLIAGGGFGIWEHLEHNYLFEAEIRPGAPAAALAGEALFGASPLLAPGILGVLGLLALLATLGDPQMAPSRTATG